MFTKTFFKFFPPPKFLDEPYAGIDISDDAVRCIQFARAPGKAGRNGRLAIVKYGTRLLEQGIVQGGYVKEKEKLIAVVSELARELNLDRVKASLPEEEMYLFKTQVPSNSNRKTIAQNIEFKLEENVPIASSDAVFYFDIIPGTQTTPAGTTSISVAAAPRKVVDTYLEVLNSAGLTVISFEMPARAMARAVIQKQKDITHYEAILLINVFKNKIGMYVVYVGVICFTSTILREENENLDITINREIKKISDYWAQRGEGRKIIDRFFISGSMVSDGNLITNISLLSLDTPLHIEIANVWCNAFSIEETVSVIPAKDSLDYAIAVGLALPISSRHA